MTTQRKSADGIQAFATRADDDLRMTPEPPVRTMRILRLPDVEDRVGLKKTQIYELMKREQFPHAMKLSVRAVGWFEHEIDAYLLCRAAQRMSAGHEQILGANRGANLNRP